MDARQGVGPEALQALAAALTDPRHRCGQRRADPGLRRRRGRGQRRAVLALREVDPREREPTVLDNRRHRCIVGRCVGPDWVPRCTRTPCWTISTRRCGCSDGGFARCSCPRPRCSTRPRPPAGGEFRRKCRTLAGNFQSFARQPWLFDRRAATRCGWQFLSHKVFRLLVPYAMLACLLAGLLGDTPVPARHAGTAGRVSTGWGWPPSWACAAGRRTSCGCSCSSTPRRSSVRCAG